MNLIKTFIFLDIETTGLSLPSITELCLVAVGRDALLKGDISHFPRIMDKLCICVRPERRIGDTAAAITGSLFFVLLALVNLQCNF